MKSRSHYHRLLRTLVLLSSVTVSAGLSACVVLPPHARPHAHSHHNSSHHHSPPSPQIVHVTPAYPMPAPGYVWRQHYKYGWGWSHPHRGWHRGWR